MPQPTKQHISGIDIKVIDNYSVSWYRYHLVFTGPGLSVELLVENDSWGIMEKKSYKLKSGNNLIRKINDLNIPSWPEFVHDADDWIIDISPGDCEVVSIAGSKSSSNWKTLLSVLSSYGIEINDGSEVSSTIVIPFPAYDKVKSEVEKLKIELSMFVLERDDLVFVECKNIEMAYMLSVGGLEYKAFELNCIVLRLKRKIELIQAKKNRQE